LKRLAHHSRTAIPGSAVALCYDERVRHPAALLLLVAGLTRAQDANSVLVVVNDTSALSKTIGEYYVRRRTIPLAHVCHLKVAPDEEIARADYDRLIAAPIAGFLREHGLVESILYIATTAGVPLRVAGDPQNVAAVDSELALLYSDIKQGPHKVPGFVPNAFFGRNTTFRHPDFPMYLVTRLAAYDFEGVRGIIDRALIAKNVGKFVIDSRSSSDNQGDDWLHAAARLLLAKYSKTPNANVTGMAQPNPSVAVPPPPEDANVRADNAVA